MKFTFDFPYIGTDLPNTSFIGLKTRAGQPLPHKKEKELSKHSEIANPKTFMWNFYQLLFN